MANALFDFDLDGGDRGFEGANGQTYTLRLRQQPPIGIDSVLFQVWDEAGADPLLGIATNPPRASKNAPALTLTGASSGSAVSPATLDGGVTIEAPVSGGHSYIVRCVVNGGKRTIANGKQVVDPTLIHERGFFVRTPLGSRKIVCTERQEFEVEGFAGALSDMMESAAGGEGGGGLSLSPGDWLNQPTAWNGSSWIPSSALQLDVVASQNGGPLSVSSFDGEGTTRATLQLDDNATLRVNALVNIAIVDGAYYGQALSFHEFGSRFDGFNVPIFRMALPAGVPQIGFFGVAPITCPSITGATTQDQLDSLIAALAALGLVTDDRFP